MKKFYFFTSTHKDDTVTHLNIYTSTLTKAYAYAFKYFVKNNCTGIPKLII